MRTALLSLVALLVAGPSLAAPPSATSSQPATDPGTSTQPTTLSTPNSQPTTKPATTIGNWTYGALFGALIVILRTADPGHPEASIPALLLASLCVPLIDHIANSTATRAKAPEVFSRE